MKFLLNAAAGVMMAGASLGSAMAGNLSGPNNLVFAPNGKLYVANQYGDDIVVYQGSNVVQTIAVGAAPFRLALDNAENLFVAIYGVNKAEEYTLAGHLEKTVNGASGFGLAADAYDDLIVTPGNAALVFNQFGKKVKTYTNDKQGLVFAGGAATISGSLLYYASGPGNGTSTVATYNVGNFLTGWPEEITTFSNNGSTAPTQIAVDASGNIYVVGLAGNLVKYSPSGSVLLTLTGFANAGGVALDGSGNIYVSEINGNDIKVFNSAGTLIGTLN
jgi:YVTN family beta-propeller protein